MLLHPLVPVHWLLYNFLLWHHKYFQWKGCSGDLRFLCSTFALHGPPPPTPQSSLPSQARLHHPGIPAQQMSSIYKPETFSHVYHAKVKMIIIVASLWWKSARCVLNSSAAVAIISISYYRPIFICLLKLVKRSWAYNLSPSPTSSFTVPNSGSRALKWYLKLPCLSTAALKSRSVTSPSL